METIPQPRTTRHRSAYWNYSAFAGYVVLAVLLLISDEPDIPAVAFLLASVVLLTAWYIALRFRRARCAKSFEAVAYVSAMIGIFLHTPDGISVLTVGAAALTMTMLLVTGLLLWASMRR